MNSTLIPGFFCSNTWIILSYAHLSSVRQLQNVSLTVPCPLAVPAYKGTTSSRTTSPASHGPLKLTPPESPQEYVCHVRAGRWPDLSTEANAGAGRCGRTYLTKSRSTGIRMDPRTNVSTQ